MPLIERVGPGNVVPLARVKPQDIGSGAGNLAYGNAAEGVASVGNALAVENERLEAAEQTGNVARGLAGVSAELEAYRLELEQDPNHGGREDAFEKKRGEIVQRFREQIKGGKFQADFDTRAFTIGENQKLGVRQGVIRRRLDIAHGDLITSVEALNKQIETTDSDVVAAGLMQQRDEMLEAGAAAGTLSHAQVADYKVKMDAVLEDMARERNALEVATAIADEYSDPAAGFAAIRDKISTDDPKLVTKAIAHAKDIYTERKLAETEAKENQKNELTRRVFSTGPDKLTHVQLADMDIDAELRSGLEHEMAAQDRAALAGQKDVKTNQKAYFEAKDILLDPRREAERETFDPYTYAPGQLSKTARDELLALKDKPDPQEAQINAEVKRYAERFLPSTTTSAGRTADFEFREAVEDAIKRKRIAKGDRHLDDAEIDEVLMGQLKIEVEGEYWGKSALPAYEFKKRGYEPEDAARVIIPPADQERISARLQKDGIAPTPELVREVYLDDLGLPQPPKLAPVKVAEPEDTF